MTVSQPLRIVLAGATLSTRLTLKSLVQHHASVVGVLEFRPGDQSGVSDDGRLDDIAQAAGIPCVGFQNINEPAAIAQIKAWQPDVCFVVGLSQMAKAELLAIPRLACVGFHPTWLPRGRGRAPIAWLVHDAVAGAVTYFVMDEGADSGPILVQEPFAVHPNDDATDVCRATELAIDRALNRWLPRLLAGEWDPEPQDDSLATYHAKRGPEDGWIDWSQSASDIHRVIRVATRPHPGAYSYLKDRKLIVWRAEIESSYPIRGVIGRVLLTDPQRGALVQTGDGLLWLNEVAWGDDVDPMKPPKLSVGQRLGYVVEDEVSRLKQRVAELERVIAKLGEPKISS